MLVQHAAEAALADEAALGQRIAHRGEMLVVDGEFRFAVGRRVVVLGAVLQRRAGVVVAAAARRGGVTEAHALEHAGGVGRHFQRLDGVQEATGLAAQLRRQTRRTLGQHLAKAAPVCRVLDEVENGVIVAEMEVATGVLAAQQPLLEALEGKRQGDAEADRVHAQLVAQLVGLDDRPLVGVVQHGAEGEDRFVFRHLPAGAGVFAVVHVKVLAAGHRALEAGGVLVEIGRLVGLAGDGVGFVVPLRLQVAHAQGADLVHHVDENRGAVVLERCGADLHRLAGLAQQGLDGLRVGDGGLALT